MGFFKAIKKAPWKKIGLIAGALAGGAFAPSVVPIVAHVATPAAQTVVEPVAQVGSGDAQELLTKLISAAVALLLLWLRSPKDHDGGGQ